MECAFMLKRWDVHSKGVHGLGFGLFGSGLRLLPAGSGVRFSSRSRI